MVVIWYIRSVFDIDVGDLMYITFPRAIESGLTLLMTRRAVMEWSQRRKCGYCENYNNSYCITLDDPTAYTLFALEWELPPAYIVP